MVTALKQTWTAPSLYLPPSGGVRSARPMTGMEKLFDIALPEGMGLGHKPGQFVEVSLFGVGEAPISICSSPSRSNGSFQLCVRRAGDLTGLLHTLTPGSPLGSRGRVGPRRPR